MANSTPAHIPMHESTRLRHEIGTEPVNIAPYRRMVGKLHYLTKI